MDSLGLDEDTPIENKMLSNAIESAQSKVEGRNFAIRKNVLQYDDVMNSSAKSSTASADKVLEGEDVSEQRAHHDEGVHRGQRPAVPCGRDARRLGSRGPAPALPGLAGQSRTISSIRPTS